MKLPPLSKADRLLLGILMPLALLAAVVSFVLTPPKKEGGLRRNPSTFFNVSYGTKAALLVLRELGYEVRQLRRPLSASSLADIDGLVILGPPTLPTDWEESALRDWIWSGHRLLLVPGGQDTEPGNAPAGLAHWLRSESVTRPGAAPEDTLLSDFRDRARRDQLLAGIQRLTTERQVRFDVTVPLGQTLKDATAKVIWQDTDGVVGLRVAYGQGEIVALSEPYPLSNRGLQDADNGLLLANLAHRLAGPQRGVIAFDEYHHGFVQREVPPQALLRMVLQGPWGYAMLQGALVGLLGLVAAGARFGKPRDVIRAQRRRQGEFADNAGRLLGQAKATRLAYRTLAEYYRDRLCRLVHLDHTADDAVLYRALQRAGDVPITWMPPRDVSDAEREDISRSRLLAKVQQWHRAIEVLQHGRG